MADRKPNSEKSKPFTSFNLFTPTKFTVCGNKKMQERWNSVFKKKDAPEKYEFFISNLLRDFGTKNQSDIFDDEEIKKYDKRKWEVILENLNFEFFQNKELKGKIRFDNFQQYWDFILTRELKEAEVKNAKNK